MPALKQQKGYDPQQQGSFTFWQTEYQPTRPGNPAATTIDNTINIELRRIHRELTLLRIKQEKPKMTDLIGGIGYIPGICGTAAYFLAKQDRKRGSQP